MRISKIRNSSPDASAPSACIGRFTRQNSQRSRRGATDAIMQQGHDVGMLARRLFPEEWRLSANAVSIRRSAPRES